MYYDSEYIISHKNVETYYGTFNLKEDVVFKFLRSENALAVFEDWPVYEGLDKKYFITTYKDPTGKIRQDIDSTVNGICISENSFTPNMRQRVDNEGNSWTRGPNVGLSDVEHSEQTTQAQSKKAERVALKEKQLEDNRKMYKR